MRSIRRKRRSVGRRNILQRLVYSYRLAVVNEDEQKTVFRTRVSYLAAFLLFLLIAALGAWLGISLFRRSPKQVGSKEQDYIQRQNIVEQALRIDSLEQIVSMQDRYVSAIQDIIEGTVRLDTVYSVDSLTKVHSEQLMDATERENEFVARYEQDERYNITAQAPAVNDISDMSLFRPTAGMVTGHFNAIETHLGVDIAASPNQSVVAVMDGTVLFSEYTSQMGYTICIVHPGQLISVYKHCESILKASGDKVSQGESIALVGRGTDNVMQGSHLHFELWYQGQPLDPEKYILFQ